MHGGTASEAHNERTHYQQSVVLVDHNSRCLCNWHVRRGGGFLFVIQWRGLWTRLIFVIAVLFSILTVALFSWPPKHEFLSTNHPALLQDLLVTRAGGLPSTTTTTTTSSMVCGFRALRTFLLLLPPGAVPGGFRLGFLFALSLLLFKFARNSFLVDTPPVCTESTSPRTIKGVPYARRHGWLSVARILAGGWLCTRETRHFPLPRSNPVHSSSFRGEDESSSLSAAQGSLLALRDP
jgi:hypothetical protein